MGVYDLSRECVYELRRELPAMLLLPQFSAIGATAAAAAAPPFLSIHLLLTLLPPNLAPLVLPACLPAPPSLPCPAEAVYTKLQASVNKNPRKLGRSSKHIINTSLVPMEEPKPKPAPRQPAGYGAVVMNPAGARAQAAMDAQARKDREGKKRTE